MQEGGGGDAGEMGVALDAGVGRTRARAKAGAKMGGGQRTD